MAYEQIVVERDGAVAQITMNRPDKLNALTQVMSDELTDAFEGIHKDLEIRAVLLTGAGRGFCAGQDLTEFEESYRSGERPNIERHLEKTYHRLIPLIVETPQPVIAAVNGVAAGAGVSLAAACDIRLASEEARFTQAFVKIGLVPDSGGTWLLPRVVGYARALELSLTGEMVDARSALDIGLVTRVLPSDTFLEEAITYTARLAAMPTRALAATKRLIREGLTADLDTSLAAEGKAQAEMGQTEDHLEGVMAFTEKREPRFEGR
jgi:2-(1,2-epoxy-1,2-dihydrophenyl)acetyl-CoA isomerase